MPGSVFDFIAGALQEATELDKLEARGTLRLALKQVGLDARTVDAAQMRAVLERAMPAQLAARGVGAPDEVCRSLVAGLGGFTPDPGGAAVESPEDVFRRLGRG